MHAFELVSDNKIIVPKYQIPSMSGGKGKGDGEGGGGDGGGEGGVMVSQAPGLELGWELRHKDLELHKGLWGVVMGMVLHMGLEALHTGP